MSSQSVGVIRSASFEFEDHSATANLVLQIEGLGYGFDEWLNKDKAWDLISSTNIRDVSGLVGRSCVIEEVSPSISRFVRLF